MIFFLENKNGQEKKKKLSQEQGYFKGISNSKLSPQLLRIKYQRE